MSTKPAKAQRPDGTGPSCQVAANLNPSMRICGEKVPSHLVLLLICN